MANELSKLNQQLATIASENSLDEIIKPLTREIHLFDTYIAGTSHITEPSVFQQIKIGDTLPLQREQNRFDENAILVLTCDGKKLGYIPEKDNVVFSRLMDAGKLLSATIIKISQKHTFTYIQIAISLIDF